MDMLDGQTECADDTFAPFLDYSSCSNNPSQPPSSYGYDDNDSKYISSPVAGPIHGSLFGTPSYLSHLSPELDMIRTTSPMNEDDAMDEDSEGSSSDQVLDGLINNLVPRRNLQGEEIYYCIDAQAPGHCCDYEDKRKCNLRYVLIPPLPSPFISLPTRL